MKKKKMKRSIILGLLIIVFLISTSSLNVVSTKALIDTNENQNNLDSVDRSAWKWTTTEVVSTESTQHAYNPSLAVDTLGNVHVAWYDYTDYAGSGTYYDIFYKRFNATTSVWTTTEVVSTESTQHAYNPSLAVDTLGNVHIAWYDETDYAGSGADDDIFYKRWDVATSVWTTTEVVSTESTSGSIYPSLAVDSAGNVHIAWEDWSDYAGAGGTDVDIFYKRWDASTSLWTTTEVVSTESTATASSPSPAIDVVGNVHISWHDLTNYAGAGTDCDIFYKRWDASTSLWTTTEVVSTESTSWSALPSLAVDVTGDMYIAWWDQTDYAGCGTDDDIFYKHWDASSSLWTTTEVVSTESTGTSYDPTLVVDALGNVHIAWEDYTDYAGSGTLADIFYKQFSGPPPAPELAFIVPNPTKLSTIYLDWDNVLGATNYYVYRSTSYIWSVEELTPITPVSSSEYIDTVPSEGLYYYVVVAENLAGNSSHSNCQYVEVKVPELEPSTRRWSTTTVVSTESTATSYNPSLAVDSAGNIHMAWEDITNYAGAGGTEYDIFYKRWDTSSSTWILTEIVSTESTGTSERPSLAVDSAGNVHIAWEDHTDYAGAGGTDDDIFYKCWNASTSTWTTTVVVSTESTLNSWYPSLTVDSADNVHIVWRDHTNYGGSGGDGDIFYKHWDASTALWTMTEVVSTESTAVTYFPTLLADSAGNIHVAWEDYTDYAGSGGDGDIFYKHWDASTTLWTMTEVVSTESTGRSSIPSLAVDTLGNVYMAWYDETDYAGSGADDDIFYKRWDSSSSSWTTTEVVSTESTETSLLPSLAVDSAGNVLIAWNDDTDYAGSGTDPDIFYKRWDSSSSLWTTTEVVSTESIGISWGPSLAVDSAGNVHIAWTDQTDYAGAGSDMDIFYKLFASPPTSPKLAFIVPNPTELPTVYLDWNNILGATTYHIYRSTSYIWSVEGLIPVASVSSSDFVDTVPSEGFYYYVVVAGNFVGNSSLSNCQYVEVKFTDLDAPELSPILPNPTELTSIFLVWNEIDGATEYYIYRSTAYIWSVEGLTPLAAAGLSSYIDTLPDEGYYFYVIVATDGVLNSTHSNCEHIEYKVAHVREFTLVSSLILAAFALVFVVTRIRKKNFKTN